jgi:outer membrane protein OmpA-like peptidoglycan-associated protein
MKHIAFLSSLLLAGAVLAPGQGWSLTSQQLCEKVFEQYGLRSEGCDLEDAPTPPVDTRTPDAEMRENHVFFASGGTGLDAGALAQISVLADVLRSPLMQGACLRLVGHSDSSGPAEQNRQIALERAQAVASELRRRLDAPERVREVASEGEDQPLPGFKPTSRHNRRVALFAKSCN